MSVIVYKKVYYSISMMRESDSFQKDPVIKNSKQQSNFRAIKQLVEAENSIRVAHNRIKVLQVNEEKNILKLNNQVGLIGKIQQVRDFSTLHNHIVQNNKLQLQQQAHQAKNQYLQLKSQHKEKIKEVYEDIKKSKKWLYLSTQEKSQEAERQISESKIKNQLEKARRRQKISAQEEIGKKSLMQFYQTKQSKIKQTKIGQIATIKSKQAIKHKELKDLSNIEMELIQKQSHSQAAYQQVKKKLDLLLNTVKAQSNLSKKSLKASIHIDRENRIQN